MSNPDIKISSIDSLSVAFPVSILFVLLTVILFQLRDSIPYFKLILWLGFPIFTFLIVAVINIVSQYISCRNTNTGKAFLGALPSLGSIILGLGIASISYCRIPITTVFTPLIIGQSVDINKNNSNKNTNSLKNTNSKECCIPKLTLEFVESKYPILTGISYGFYVMFSILFGIVIGTGISTIC
jgi:hypothetical protein